MKDKIIKRWIFVVLIWAGVIFLTCWNVSTMERIKSPGKKIETSRMERQFLHYNRENISRVLEKRASFHQPVESLKLGLLSIENQLKGLLSAYHLKDVKTEFHQSDAIQGNIPIMLSFQGPFEGMMKLLSVLRKDYPYLLINRVKIIPDQLQNKIRFQILFKYRYRISFGESRI